MSSEKIIDFQIQVPQIRMKYIPIEGRMTIGEKRNIAIDHASHDIILFMDDDDHYPETSFRRRVSWLTKHPWGAKATACTTIACYDLIRGVSSVNTPPWNLSLGKRVSEATLTFYKSWWEEQKFPAENLSEGDRFLEGREQDVLELPPQQVIVAFTHTKNTSGRHVPSGDIKPGCFWGFPKEYLIYIHRIVGMEIEEER
jgi:glycosyltransferase involved in cell wall biosynthesis